MNLGNRLKARRQEIGLSVPDVAKRAGMGVATLYDLERGTQQSTPKLHKLAKVLGLHVEYLDTGKGPRLLTEAASVGSVREDRQTYHSLYSLGAEAARIGWEWQKLLDRDPAAAEMLGEMIELIVAAKVRAQRAPKKKGEGDSPRDSVR